ncbi:MAG: selenide, water dikinase SelD [Acidimicrobiia bacterium]|nr:selenide, water dikinase SelD [Acidimicrobiia bacterium]
MPTPTDQIRLRSWTSCGGCGAKWPAAELRALLAARPAPVNPDGLLVGLAPFDDAAVLLLTPELSLVSTTDFFPPLVDDPAAFGAIAAANACSDIFAMGARVVLAVNVAAFPEELPTWVVAAILAAADEVVAEAGGVIAGGHTIRNPEPVFGLAVQGLVPTGRHFSKGGVRPGDRIVLSKPLGTGLVLAADDAAPVAGVTAGMRQLNRVASEALVARHHQVHAVTDVTGFGLLGHGFEMAERSGVTLELDAALLPLYDGALAAAAAGVRTGADERNRTYTAGQVEVQASDALAAVGYDPQTSGGLLAAVDPTAVAELTEVGFVEIGEAVPLASDSVHVRLS